MLGQTFETLHVSKCFWHVAWVEAGIELHLPSAEETKGIGSSLIHAAEIPISPLVLKAGSTKQPAKKAQTVPRGALAKRPQ